MSDFIARAALSRMNLREVAMAAHYSGFSTDLQALSHADAKSIESNFLETRRAEMAAAYGFTSVEQRKPFAFANGIAIIPISGSLINRFSGSYEGWVTGYNFIRRQLHQAVNDEDVTGIIFDVHSYGGEAAGCFELAAEIRASRDKKPSLALVDSAACSAAYALATSATRVVAIPSATVGSVGVITMHIDMSQALDKYGYKVTLIFEAEHKADGNPYEKLPDDVKSEIKARIHTAYETFVGVVAENLGVDAKVIRDTKSRSYGAKDALALGLIHAIESPMVAAQAFLDELSGSTTNLRTGEDMTTATTEPGANAQAQAQATAQAAQEARTAERARMGSILGCEEAKGREALANHIAMKTDMSLEDAKAMLAASAKAEPAAAATTTTAQPAANANGNKAAFENAMNVTGNPNVGADGEGGGESADDKAATSILSAHSAATGIKHGK